MEIYRLIATYIHSWMYKTVRDRYISSERRQRRTRGLKINNFILKFVVSLQNDRPTNRKTDGQLHFQYQVSIYGLAYPFFNIWKATNRRGASQPVDLVAMHAFMEISFR